MDKNFLYIMLGAAIILIIILATSQNRSGNKQPADIMNDLLTSPSPTVNLNQQSQQSSSTTSTTVVNNQTSLPMQTLEGGLKIQDITIGEGEEVKSGDTISIHYKGALENGTKFDSSYDRGEPFETQIGVGQVIKGWDLGVVGMKVGGKRKMIIPPSLGYGSQSVGGIPADSTLIFDVELVSIKKSSEE